MGQRAGVLRFGTETLERLGVIGVLGAQQLDRYRPVEQQVRRPPHLTDAPGRDGLIQLVAVIEYQASSRHNHHRLPMWHLIKRDYRQNSMNIRTRFLAQAYFSTRAPTAGRAAFTCLAALPRTVL